MATGEFDKEDVALAGIFVLAAASTVGIADVTLFDTSFSEGVGVGVGEFTLGTLLSAGIFAFGYLTNDNDVQSLDDTYRYTVYGTLALILAPAFITPLYDIVTQNDLFRVLAVTIQSLGYAAVSYMA